MPATTSRPGKTAGPLTIDGHAPGLNVAVDVPQNSTMSRSVDSVWLKGPGINAELPSTFTWFSTYAGLKRFEMTFDNPAAGNYTVDLLSGSNASGAYSIRISEVPEPSAALLAVIGGLAIGWQCRTASRLTREPCNTSAAALGS